MGYNSSQVPRKGSRWLQGRGMGRINRMCYHQRRPKNKSGQKIIIKNVTKRKRLPTPVDHQFTDVCLFVKAIIQHPDIAQLTFRYSAPFFIRFPVHSPEYRFRDFFLIKHTIIHLPLITARCQARHASRNTVTGWLWMLTRFTIPTFIQWVGKGYVSRRWPENT